MAGGGLVGAERVCVMPRYIKFTVVFVAKFAFTSLNSAISYSLPVPLRVQPRTRHSEPSRYINAQTKLISSSPPHFW